MSELITVSDPHPAVLVIAWEISHRLGLSKNTVLDIVKRDRAA